MFVLLDQDDGGDELHGGFSQHARAELGRQHQPALADLTTPVRQLLYDEQAADIVLDDTDEVTMLLKLSHSDTARINGARGTTAAKGRSISGWRQIATTFPPLTIRNERGHKATYLPGGDELHRLRTTDARCRVDSLRPRTT